MTPQCKRMDARQEPLYNHTATEKNITGRDMITIDNKQRWLSTFPTLLPGHHTFSMSVSPKQSA